MANIVFNPSSGELNKEVGVSGDCNPDIDQTFEYLVQTGDGKVSHTLTVNQEGKREPLDADDGEFLTSDGEVFGVVKDKWASDPDCS